ncbi:MAG: hypothetical protein OEW67_04675 [Cyclobacteriaceae bacterium]|nr:hypothetical protein [Cyclobacteriaceae bacterium]
MKKINTLEQDAFEEIANIGLSKAADSLSTIVNEKVLLKTTKMGINFSKRLEQSGSQDYVVLTTHVKGEHEGTCLLIFSQEEVFNIKEKCLYNNDDKKMLEALLLEIDNIISASVITQLANILDLNIYGSVPEISLLSLDDLKKHLIDMKSNYDPLLFSTNLISDNLDLEPDFFWFFKEGMLQTLQKVVNE